MSVSGDAPENTRFDLYFILILIITLTVPVLVLPMVIDNCFNTPKNLAIIIGVAVLAGIYCIRFFGNKEDLTPSGPTFKLLLFLIMLNLFSFFYTGNNYFTAKAAVLNIACLVIFYFVCLNTDGKRVTILLSIIMLSGVLVSIITWLQFFNIFILIRWSEPGAMLMGTIGNSNYLGAYLVFPLYAAVGLIFTYKGKWRLIPALLSLFILGAFLFPRARASWMGFFLVLPFSLFLIKRIYDFSIIGFIKSNPIKMIIGGLVTLLILVSMLYLVPQRFYAVMSPKNVFESETLRLRMQKYFPPSIWLFKQSPLFGTGLWSYRNLVYEAQAEINRVDPEYFKNYPKPKPRRAHNEYLEILNDGGLLAAAVLTLFLIVIMRHGWSVIKDENADKDDRVNTAIGFCSIIAIMLTSIFFFSFRVNSTLLMTVLMLGIMEGNYLKSNDMIATRKGIITGAGKGLMVLIIIVLIGVVWFTGIKPFKGEVEHFQYKLSLAKKDGKAAERHILRAIEYDPHNSAYYVYAAQLYFNIAKDFVKASDYVGKAIDDFNGDVTLYSIHYLKGLIKYRMGSLFEARKAFEKALYYNPTMTQASDRLSEVNKIIKDHDRVTIKYR